MQRESPDLVKKFFLKPDQQIVGIYGKLDTNFDVVWFSFIFSKQNWKMLGAH